MGLKTLHNLITPNVFVQPKLKVYWKGIFWGGASVH